MLHAAGPNRINPEPWIIEWLLDSDPSIRRQVIRDILVDRMPPADVEREKAEQAGWAQAVLSQQAADGSWGGVAWNRGWDSTLHALMLLRDLGEFDWGFAGLFGVRRVAEQVTWAGCGPPEVAHHRFFEGETEPCINAQVAAVGAHFGQDVQPLIERLLGEQLPDGGWNCEAENGSTHSSFHTTICVLEALLAYEQHGGAGATDARRRGEEYLLERRLFRRRSTGEPIVDRKASGADWSCFAFPTWWHYDILRGLEYLRAADVTPDARVDDAIAIVKARRDDHGRWLLGAQYPGRMLVDFGERVGEPSRWITLRAVRVLKWYEARR